MLQVGRLVDMNLKQQSFYFLTGQFEADCAVKLLLAVSKNRKISCLHENVLSVWSFFPETLTVFGSPATFSDPFL